MLQLELDTPKVVSAPKQSICESVRSPKRSYNL